MLLCILAWFLFLSPCRKHEWILLQYSLWESGRTTGTKNYKWEFLTDSPQSFWLRIPHTEPLAIHQLQFRFSYRGSIHSRRGFCSWVSAPGSWDSLYLPVCLILRAAVCCNLTLPMDIEELLIFHFTCLLRWISKSLTYGNLKSVTLIFSGLAHVRNLSL